MCGSNTVLNPGAFYTGKKKKKNQPQNGCGNAKKKKTKPQKYSVLFGGRHVFFWWYRCLFFFFFGDTRRAGVELEANEQRRTRVANKMFFFSVSHSVIIFFYPHPHIHTTTNNNPIPHIFSHFLGVGDLKKIHAPPMKIQKGRQKKKKNYGTPTHRHTHTHTHTLLARDLELAGVRPGTMWYWAIWQDLFTPSMGAYFIYCPLVSRGGVFCGSPAFSISLVGLRGSFSLIFFGVF